MIEAFSGGTITALSLGQDADRIRSLANNFLCSSTPYDQYPMFGFSIEADTTQFPVIIYRLHQHHQYVAAYIRRKAGSRNPLLFGRSDAANLPDPALCNFHCSLGKVLEAAGVSQVIMKIVRDDKDYRADGGNLPSVPSAYMRDCEIFYMDRRLAVVAAQRLGYGEEEDARWSSPLEESVVGFLGPSTPEAPSLTFYDRRRFIGFPGGHTPEAPLSTFEDGTISHTEY